jgi:hypothetical protein
MAIVVTDEASRPHRALRLDGVFAFVVGSIGPGLGKTWRIFPRFCSALLTVVPYMVPSTCRLWLFDKSKERG